MAPSTVFSYWRRDHRRPTSSSVPTSPLPVSTANSSEIPPQLPGIPDTPTFSDTIIESSGLSDAYSPSPLSETHLDWADNKLEAGAFGSSTQQSPTNLRVPSPSLERLPRPHSSPEENKKGPAITSQSNLSQQSFVPPRQEYPESESPKPSSPWRLAFGKGLLNPQTQSPEGHKRTATHGGTAGGSSRFKTPPQDTPWEVGASPKDFKLDNIVSRRDGDHDVSAEHIHQKSGKTKLHLLNPMSLLARRRSSQMAHLRPEDLNIGVQNLIPAIPDDYDPRIRGKIVHDFSAPRPRRNVSTVPAGYQDANKKANGQDLYRNGYGPQTHSTEPYTQSNERSKRHSEHSPVFKEHFGDDRKTLQIENKGYLQSSLLTDPPPHDLDPAAIPAFAKNLPLRLPDNNDKPRERTIEIAEPAAASHPPTKRASSKSQQQGNVDTPQASGLPKHLKSNASRFSFDMSGIGSSVQEKLLEEKHKEKEAARKAKAKLEGSGYSDSEDDFDYDLDADDDGLEERIPGVNADADEDEEFSGFSGRGRIVKNSLFVPALPTVMASPVSPAGSNPVTLPTPRDAQGQVIGYAVTKDSPLWNQSDSPSDYGDSADEEQMEGPQGHELIGMERPVETSDAPAVSDAGKQQSLDDDNFYFDDGEFGDISTDAEGERFDESIFDDESSHLYERRSSTRVLPVVPEADIAPSGPSQETIQTAEASTKDGSLRHVPSLASEFESRAVQNCLPEPVPTVGPPKSQVGVLSEYNLEAFHHALTKAANEAAANQRFQRTTSVSETSMGRESTTQTAESHPGLVSDDSRLSQSQTVDTMAFDDVFDDFNYDDDGFDDDAIIAEANAEALENDDEGFYGQEFGFYAQLNGSCSSELVNGGYFIPRGVEGVTRSHSGRVNFQEPSLTPITERSEWSTRNSIISLTAHGAAHSNPSLSSPGLAQLLDMGSIDDEMSLSALMKLRRGAWGGSNGSLRSSAGSPSPHPQQPPSNRGSFHGTQDACAPSVDPNTNPADSTSGLNTTYSPLRLSDEEGSPASPTLTSSFYQNIGRPAASDGETRPTPRTGPGKSHSRNSSSASISYVKEMDEDGSSKWVLERRRPSDSGEMEVYQREILKQGRI